MKIAMTSAAVAGVLLLIGTGWLVSDLEGTRLQVGRLNRARGSSEDLVRNWGVLQDSLGRAAESYDAARERAAYRAFVQSCDFTPRVILDLGVTRRNVEGESLATLSDQILGLGAQMAHRAENVFARVANRGNLSEESQTPANRRSRKSQVAVEIQAVDDVTRRAMSRLDDANAILAEEVASLVDRERIQSRWLYALVGAGILGLGLCVAWLLRSRTRLVEVSSPLAADGTVPDVEAELVPVEASDLVPCGAVFSTSNHLPPREFRREAPWDLPRDTGSSWSVDQSPTERGSDWLARTVLVVEDDVQVRSLACETLRGQGYDVLEAGNGFEALRIAERVSLQLDLVLSDVVMPRMSGHELVERLTSCRPELPVLLMSGYLDETITPREGAGSECPLIHKPFSPKDLVRKVREVLPIEAGRV